MKIRYCYMTKLEKIFSLWKHASLEKYIPSIYLQLPGTFSFVYFFSGVCMCVVCSFGNPISWCRCSDGLRFDHVGICYITKLRTIVSFNIQTHVYLIIFTVIFHNSGTKIKTICFWRSDLSVIQSLYVISDNQNIIGIYFIFFFLIRLPLNCCSVYCSVLEINDRPTE